MNILHTADWHIGKVLHKHSLQEEHKLFFEWLIKTIHEEEIDLLIVSGDIFDLSNPAAKDRQAYYNFLSRLIQVKTKIIITGGNHDSIGVLNAPRQILNALDIHVVGGASENLKDELIEIKGKNGALELIVAAVPFLRDRDLRKNDSSHQQSSRVESLRAGIKKHYDDLAQLSKELYPDIPLIGMGHLYAKGSVQSESEREIHIGNAAVIEAKIFSKSYDYLALGHIHRPQVINKNDFIRYSGSPLALSFSEKEDQKIILKLQLENGTIQPPMIIKVPKFRELKKISGSLDHVAQGLKEFVNASILPSFIEIEVTEDVFSSHILVQMENLIAQHRSSTRFNILKSNSIFKTGSRNTADLFNSGENIEDLSEQEVFAKKLESENIDLEQQDILKAAFLELLDFVHEQESL